MAKRGRAKRRRDDSDDEESETIGQRDAPMEELPDADSAASESDGEAEKAPATVASENPNLPPPESPVADPKRKRVPLSGTPTTAQEEAELARRRRRRQSLVFQKRRQSLTPSTKASDDHEPPQNRQYISDMYSTIIKMSSENKINIKNTWSLHLIDHMEDILSAPQVERPGAIEDPNTFNFQKASCTLDASVKIYSYRVDDTWTSSYKILENLSRSGGDKRAAGEEDGDEDEEGGEGGEEGEEGTQRRGKKKSSRKPASAARTIEKNINNITLKSYELDFEPDPLFHKMSQTFDEGGAKGMLLANLGVYDGAKILLNSADVLLSTRKVIEKKHKSEDNDDDSPPVEEDTLKPKSSKIDLSVLGKLSCFSKDVTSMPVCPPLRRLYDQIEELRDPDTTQPKVVLKKSVLTLQPRRPSPSDEESIMPSTPVPDDTFATVPSVANGDGDAEMEDVFELPPIEQDEDGNDQNVDDGDDDDDDDNDQHDASFEFGGGDEMDVEMEDADAPSSVSATDATASVDEDPHNTSHVEVDVDDNEPVTERHVDPVTHSSNEPKPVVIKSAADYFRAQVDDDTVKNEEDFAYSQLIETALMRSVILEAEGTEEVSDRNDYSYFDAKLLKNWAGPSHLKFKGARRLPTNLLAFVEDQEEGAAVPTKRGRKPNAKKNPTLVAEKKSLVVDFFSADVPDFAKLLKVPKATGSTGLTKLVVKRQMQKSADLVFPVDAHIDSKIFFRHFLKPRLQLFHRRMQPSRGMEADESALPSASDPGLADADNLAFDDNGNDFGNDFGGYSDDDESDHEIDREANTSFFSSANLITAERVVEKVDVHYERVAKRVDVKKLKTSLWSHLESETALLGKRKSRQSDAVEPEPERNEDQSGASNDIEPTTFENVVHGIAGKVPENVTVSFYFICMLHLANEKGLRLTGKEDLSDFAIKKEEPLSRN